MSVRNVDQKLYTNGLHAELAYARPMIPSRSIT